ncbi:MAG: M1 family metallopeptidase [Candidatus Paceibacterota bacterium]|jgi:puromycin-sensitive aminopeptidase
MRNKSVRLSKKVIPTKYKLELKPDLENFTFSGRESISVNVLQKTKTITLHSKEIDIETADLTIKNEKIFGKISYDKKSDTATFTFPQLIPPGKYELTLVFQGILNDKMRGFYRSKYNVRGKAFHMATTQFEATDARRAFPCFDEPAQKAVFHVSLVVPRGKTAISNTLPISVKEHEAGFDTIEFAPTPKMSTYLLAFIVGDLEYVEKKSRGRAVRVWTTHGKSHQAHFALDCAVKTLEFYEKYFDIKFPLPTLDMIAIPDFSSGAMENWGAITYRESALLVDPHHSSVGNKQWVALVVAHELAHQWFGNLVTMEWWTHLWLNEGFASYIEYLAVDKLFPKWDIWTQFMTDDMGRSLRLDALASTHPIEVEVHHPDEIGEIFDEVSYSKGASLIRMLAGYLGERNFRDGLRHYLKKHSYKNTSTIHLWEAFEKVSGKPVAKMMKNWTGKPGYPVVRVSALGLSQERFFASPISAKKAKDKTIWQISVQNMKTNFLRGLASDGEPTSGIFKLKKFRTDKKFSFHNYIKLNFGETGFYRTAYSKELLEKLYEPIQNKNFSSRDRLGIIRDLFALAEAGTIPTTDALEFLDAYKNEDNYTVWLEVANGLARLRQLLAKTPVSEKVTVFTMRLFSSLAEKMGWAKKKDEHHTGALLRSLAIDQAGQAGDKEIIREARKKFNSPNIPPDIRGAVYSVVATHGGVKEFNQFIAKYKKETLHEEKNRLGSALGDFKNENLLLQACEFAMSSNVRPQDTVGILSSVGANSVGRDIWWNFMKKNWKTLVSRYGEGGLTLGRAMKAIGGSAEPKHLADIRKFFKTHPAPGAKRSIEQVLERLEGNIAWLKRDGEIIAEFLNR